MSILHIAFYPSDWLAGTRGLSDSETGIYITLIARMYEMAGPIERDDNRLFRLCGSKSKASFVKALEYLISEGKITQSEDGLFNDRVKKEIEKATEKSSAAKTAAKARWDKKTNKINDPQNADASHAHMQNGCQLEPEPELEKEEPNGSSKNKATKPRKSRLDGDWQLPLGWGLWARKQGMSEAAIRHEADQFKDHHIARGNTMLDWKRAWQTWVRNHLKFSQQKQPMRQKRADQMTTDEYLAGVM